MGAIGNQLSIGDQVLTQVHLTESAQGLGCRPFFRACPPERVGLNGEYDYYGLSKRVRVQCKERLGKGAIAGLAVLQRGRVVILHGHIANRALLKQVIQIALQQDGIADVELRGLTIDDEVLSA